VGGGNHCTNNNASHLYLTASDAMLMGNRNSRRHGAVDMEMADLTGLPMDDALLNKTRDILGTMDLMSVTKEGRLILVAVCTSFSTCLCVWMIAKL
jgi:hypothetical protein